MKGSNLLKKAKDDIDLAARLIDEEQQHDNVGYHLAQAMEKLLKFVCEQKDIKYLKSAKGHDLQILFSQLLVQDDYFKKYRNLLLLDAYQSNVRYDYLPLHERVDLKMMLTEIYEFLADVEAD